MSSVQVTSNTQHIDVDLQEQHVTVDEGTKEVTIVVPEVSSISVTNAGPVGPPSPLGDYNDIFGTLVDEIDTRVATHNQGTPIHTNATSGRDFAALFQNGLI